MEKPGQSRLGMLDVRSALDKILGRTPEPSTPLQASRGNLHEATARRLGIPILKRPEVTPPRVKSNRAERRAKLRADVHARSLRLDTYSRRLTSVKADGQ